MKTTSTEQSSSTPQTNITYGATTNSTGITGTGSISIGSAAIYTGTTWTSNNSIDSSYGITFNDGSKTHRLEDLFYKMEKLEKIIGVLLEEPTPETLEQHRALKDAYEKYKMVERMILGEDAK